MAVPLLLTNLPDDLLLDAVLPSVPVNDTLALCYTCRTWHRIFVRHNHVAQTAQDREVRRIHAPPDAYLLTRVALVEWATQCGSWDRLNKLGEEITEGGNLDVLKLYRERGGEWRRAICTGAARGGHLTVLQWARQNGCPWDKRTCAGAAKSGHLAVLQWARQIYLAALASSSSAAPWQLLGASRDRATVAARCSKTVP